MGGTLLCENNLPKYFWAEAVNAVFYVSNRVLFRKFLNKTPYELWKGRNPNVSYLRAFRCKYFVLNNNKDNFEKFDAKSNEGIFLGYSPHSKAYRVYNKRILAVEESIHVTFNELNYLSRKIVSTSNLSRCVNLQERLAPYHTTGPQARIPNNTRKWYRDGQG